MWAVGRLTSKQKKTRQSPSGTRTGPDICQSSAVNFGPIPTKDKDLKRTNISQKDHEMKAISLYSPQKTKSEFTPEN